jgi:hypothetical protein
MALLPPNTTEAVEEAIRVGLERYELTGYEHGSCWSRPDEERLAEIAVAADREALADAGYAIVKRPSRVELERAFEIAYGKEPDKHEAAVLLAAKRCIFGESLEMKV